MAMYQYLMCEKVGCLVLGSETCVLRTVFWLFLCRMTCYLSSLHVDLQMAHVRGKQLTTLKADTLKGHFNLQALKGVIFLMQSKRHDALEIILHFEVAVVPNI